MSGAMRPEEAKKLETMLDSATLIYAGANHSLAWVVLTDEQRDTFTRLANLAERMIVVLREQEASPALTAAHAAKM